MSLIKKEYLKELRERLVSETEYNISDEDWNKIIKNIEDDIIKGLREEIPKAFYSTLYDWAEKGDVIVKINDVDLGEAIRNKRDEKDNE